MPRRDPTFTDADLFRFYCNNLDPAEKARVLQKFKAHLLTHTPICPNDTKIDIDFCKWANSFYRLTTLCKEIGEEIPEILAILTTLETALLGLSWTGWLGRLLMILRALLGFLITAISYVGAIMIMLGELRPLAEVLVQFFCFYHYDVELPGDPPDLTKLPKSPGDEINEFLNGIRESLKDLGDFEITPGP